MQDDTSFNTVTILSNSDNSFTTQGGCKIKGNIQVEQNIAVKQDIDVTGNIILNGKFYCNSFYKITNDGYLFKNNILPDTLTNNSKKKTTVGIPTNRFDGYFALIDSYWNKSFSSIIIDKINKLYNVAKFDGTNQSYDSNNTIYADNNKIIMGKNIFNKSLLIDKNLLNTHKPFNFININYTNTIIISDNVDCDIQLYILSNECYNNYKKSTHGKLCNFNKNTINLDNYDSNILLCNITIIYNTQYKLNLYNCMHDFLSPNTTFNKKGIYKLTLDNFCKIYSIEYSQNLI